MDDMMKGRGIYDCPFKKLKIEASIAELKFCF